MLVRGKLEYVSRVYITSNRNVGQRYASPLFGCRISLSFSRMTTSPRLYFWSWTGSPLRRRDVLLIYECFVWLWVNFCFLLLVNRSPRSAVLPAVGRFCLCVSTWSLGHEALPCVTTSVGTSSLFFHKVFRIQRSRFRLRTSWAHLVRNWPLHFSLGLCNF